MKTATFNNPGIRTGARTVDELQASNPGATWGGFARNQPNFQVLNTGFHAGNLGNSYPPRMEAIGASSGKAGIAQIAVKKTEGSGLNARTRVTFAELKYCLLFTQLTVGMRYRAFWGAVNSEQVTYGIGGNEDTAQTGIREIDQWYYTEFVASNPWKWLFAGTQMPDPITSGGQAYSASPFAHGDEDDEARMLELSQWFTQSIPEDAPTEGDTSQPQRFGKSLDFYDAEFHSSITEDDALHIGRIEPASAGCNGSSWQGLPAGTEAATYVSAE